jgi:hypothetical protein
MMQLLHSWYHSSSMAREVRNLCEKDWSSKSDEREVRNLFEKDWSGAPTSGRFATCVKKVRSWVRKVV